MSEAANITIGALKRAAYLMRPESPKYTLNDLSIEDALLQVANEIEDGLNKYQAGETKPLSHQDIKKSIFTGKPKDKPIPKSFKWGFDW